ncbi:MAG TPA: PilN domain-containing protein [Candidatus Binatia bacterium]|jgi:hypothetical protein|nr:PilN domain-containing protein [Candidatus Binatia bacterium]
MRVLGLDIGDHELRVAHGEQRLGAARVTRLERIRLDGPDALSAAIATLDIGRGTRVHVAVPLQATTHRLLVLPFRDRGRLARTAPLELLGQLPIDPASVHVATLVLGPRDGGSEVLAVAIRRDDRGARLALVPSAQLALAPLAAAALLPRDEDDAVLLVADGARSALVRRQQGRVTALRALGADTRDADALAAEVQWVLHAWGSAPRLLVVGPDAAAAAHLGTVLDDPAGAVATGLVVASGSERLVLAGDAQTSEPGWWHRAAALAAAAVVLALVNVAIVRTDLDAREAALNRAIDTVAAAALPDVPATTARTALEDAAAARRRGHPGDGTPVLEVLREVSARIPPAVRLDLDELALEPDAIVLHGRCDSFDAADALRRALAASPFVRDVRMEETRTTVDGRGVEFRLRAERRTTVGAPS